MSEIKKLKGSLDSTFMDVRMTDSDVWYVPIDCKTGIYACLGCGLIWSRKHRAINCESRNHETYYIDTYKWRNGNIKEYVRKALRRKGKILRYKPKA
jgi:hypothetical protein